MVDYLTNLGWPEIGVIAGLTLALFLAVSGWLSSRRKAKESAEAARAVERRLSALEALGDGLAFVGSGSRFTYVNKAAARLLGFTSAKQLFGKNWRTVLPEEESRRLDRELTATFADSGHWFGLVDAPGRGGHAASLELSVSRMEGGGASWILRSGDVRDSAMLSLRASEARYRTLFKAAGSVLVVLGDDRAVIDWNSEAERRLGETRDRAIGRDFLDLVAPDELRGQITEQLEIVLTTGQSVRFETPVPGAQDQRLAWHLTSLPEEVDGGRGLIAVGQDTTGLRQAEEALSEQEGLYKLLANNVSDLVILHDLDGRCLYASPSCNALLGFPPEELAGKDLFQLSHSDDWKRIQASFVAALAGRHHRTSFRMKNASGEFRWFETLMRPIRDQQGQIVQLQSASRDVSERKKFEDQLEHQALHEPLTGLPNRTLFLDRVNQALARSKRESSPVAVMFMDLDRFKIINDSMGHAAGDRLIAAVAHRIRDCLREADTVARLGGDEFGVLLEFNVRESDAQVVAERILKTLEPPFMFAGTDVFVSASIGIAFSTPETETPEDLLRYADVAMYRAKDEGPGNWRTFDPDVDYGATRRLEMETALRRAIERDEFRVVYQPLVDLKSGRISGMEALIRWEHPERGWIGPMEFIPIAEETGLIVPMGLWIMRRSCEEAVRWHGLGRDDVLVSVNLSTRQFEHPDLERDIAAILSETGLAPAKLQLEITESELMRSAARVGTLKELGVRVAIDDFGTGYSSLAYLKDMKADSLKVDRSFVSGLGESREDMAIVQTVITLASSLGLDVTAEGIETELHLAELRRLECGSGQGYFFSKPIPPEEARALVESDPRW
jgi:diguanylate cyclase (GGDEF)-like protein/PAS domain S-box-containing protein